MSCARRFRAGMVPTLWAVAWVLAAAPASAQVGSGSDTTAASLPAVSGALSPAVFGTVSPELPGPAAPPPYHPGSLGLALGEALLSNFVPWASNEYITRYKDITRISPTRWKENLAQGLQWDDNHFHVNMLLHPYAGSLSFNAGRTNGYSFEKSFLFAVLASALWECCGESHRPSAGDLVSTTIGGAALGEMSYRWTSQILNRANQGSRSGWWEVPVAVLNPTRTFTRWTLGRFAAPNPRYVEPSSWAVFGETGWLPASGRLLQEVGYTYGDVIAVATAAPPFTHFETAFELALCGSPQVIERVQARGSLWSRRMVAPLGVCLLSSEAEALSQCVVKYFNIIPFLGFDYINNSAYEFGGQSVGLTPFFTVGRYPGGTHGALALEGHVLFGGVKSEHAKLAQLHDVRSEREREYDFTVATGWGVAAIGSHGCLHATGFYRRNRHWVVDGSSEAGPANHRTTLAGAQARCRLFGRLGLGVEYRRYTRKSRFDSSLFPDRVWESHDRLGLFLTVDRVRPLGLFVF